ncbi:uncharacterized protein [Cardiocondyla obscurior]|uniref:uncharacterized protein n=1 Tax=Cardiocondyla obscurior TaxID=286306 RepID=UPI0039655C1D
MITLHFLIFFISFSFSISNNLTLSSNLTSSILFFFIPCISLPVLSFITLLSSNSFFLSFSSFSFILFSNPSIFLTYISFSFPQSFLKSSIHFFTSFLFSFTSPNSFFIASKPALISLTISSTFTSVLCFSTSPPLSISIKFPSDPITFTGDFPIFKLFLNTSSISGSLSSPCLSFLFSPFLKDRIIGKLFDLSLLQLSALHGLPSFFFLFSSPFFNSTSSTFSFSLFSCSKSSLIFLPYFVLFYLTFNFYLPTLLPPILLPCLPRYSLLYLHFFFYVNYTLCLSSFILQITLTSFPFLQLYPYFLPLYLSPLISLP